MRTTRMASPPPCAASSTYHIGSPVWAVCILAAAIVKLPPGRLAHGLQWRAQTLRSRLYDMNLQQRRRPPMRPETRDSLKRRLRPEVETLSRMLDRDLTSWVAA